MGKRTYTPTELVRDVIGLARLRPSVYGLFVKKRLDPALREKIAVAVSETNECPVCLFIHSNWSGIVGADGANETAEREETALGYAAARTRADLVPVPEDLDAAFRRTFSPVEQKDIEVVIQAMTVANRFNNSWETFLRKLAGSR